MARRFIHPCEWPDCRAWGSRGFGAFPWTPRGRPDVKANRGHWYCGAHASLVETGTEAAERRSPAPVEPARQGALAL